MTRSRNARHRPAAVRRRDRLALGGWSALPDSRRHAVIQGPFWFTTKVLVFIFFYVWVRGTLPRFRYDQLMSFGWKLLLPVSLANLVITAFVIILPKLRHP